MASESLILLFLITSVFSVISLVLNNVKDSQGCMIPIYLRYEEVVVRGDAEAHIPAVEILRTWPHVFL